MKLDSDPALCHSTLIHRPSSKSFEYNDNDMDTAGLKETKEIMKEHQHGILFDVKGNENDVDSLQSEMNDGDNSSTASESDCSTGVDNLPNGDKSEIRDFASPYSHSSRKLGSFEKETDSYTDKSVMECELPELVVCYKETTYHDIKDICIDEGVPSWDKILIESGMDECKGSYAGLHRDKDTDCDVMKEVDNAISILDDLKSSSENVCDKDSVNQHDSKDLTLISVAHNSAAERNLDDVSEKSVPENMPFVQELGTEDSLSKFSVCDGHGVDQLPVKVTSEEAILAIPALISAAEESNNSCEEASLNLASESVAEESNISSLTNDLLYNSMVENGSITFDFDSSAAEASSREDSSQNGDHGHPETRALPRLEDLISNSQRVLSQDKHGHGDSSFSMAGHFSGVISYSGPVAYSGSLSHRSDSSTTSTRSFAFPVLQSEWNSSPVRMAKADRRHLRKQRGWRQGLLCCRF